MGDSGARGQLDTLNAVDRRRTILADRDGWLCFYCCIPLIPVGSRENCIWIACTPTEPCAAYSHPAGGWCPDGGFWLVKSGFAAPIIEHVVPRSRGGGNNLENLVLACDWCNHRKGNRLLSELPADWASARPFPRDRR
jgi:5-methylcytosine-specific restriction endonuclease McrA